LLITLTLLSAQQVCPFVFGGRNFGWHLAKRCCLRLCPHLACDSHSHDEERRALLARSRACRLVAGSGAPLAPPRSRSRFDRHTVRGHLSPPFGPVGQLSISLGLSRSFDALALKLVSRPTSHSQNAPVLIGIGRATCRRAWMRKGVSACTVDLRSNVSSCSSLLFRESACFIIHVSKSSHPL
jgi:hypothetical protein